MFETEYESMYLFPEIYWVIDCKIFIPKFSYLKVLSLSFLYRQCAMIKYLGIENEIKLRKKYWQIFLSDF